MSRIYFHAKNGEAEVSGRERVAAAALLRQPALFAYGLDGNPAYVSSNWTSPLQSILPEQYKTMKGRELNERLQLWVARNSLFGEDAARFKSGQPIDMFSVELNTALAIGGDIVKFLARLHGQCEMHAYVEPENGKWLANIIDSGCVSGVLTETRQWESVCDLLTSTDSPVVMSYSVTEQFPNVYMAQKGSYRAPEDDKDKEHWYSLTDDQRWDFAIEGLRKWNKTSPLEMNPETWNSFYFGNGYNAFTLLKKIQSEEQTK